MTKYPTDNIFDKADFYENFATRVYTLPRDAVCIINKCAITNVTTDIASRIFSHGREINTAT